MKLLHPIFIFGALLMIASCKQAEPVLTDEASDQIEPRIGSGNVSIHLHSFDHTDSAQTSIQYEYYTSLDKAFQDSVNIFIKSFIARETTFEGGDVDNPVMSRQFVASKLEAFRASYEEQLDEESNGGVWSLEMSIHIDEGQKEFVSLGLSSWAYTGGAHGNGYYGTEHFNIPDGRLLSLEDFITDIDALSAIVEPIFRSNVELDADTDLNEAGFWFEDGKFAVNENFSFGDGTMTFVYNSYEIAPYSAGTFEVSVPFASIKHLLKRKID